MEKTYDATIDYTPADVRWPYRRLEYITLPVIETGSLPRIDTDYYPIGAKIDMRRTALDETYRPLFRSTHYLVQVSGQQEVLETTSVMLRSISSINTNMQWIIENNSVGSKSYLLQNLGTTRHTIEINYGGSRTIKVDGTVVHNNISVVTPKAYVTVFGAHEVSEDADTHEIISESWWSSGMSAELYSIHFQIDSNTQVALIPAQRKSDGAVGLYDTTAGVFLPNSNTRPDVYDFVAGPTADECWDMTDPG